jgi:hypothetical protein
MRCRTAMELWGLLSGIFPGFAEECSEEKFPGDATLHFVMREFLPHFSGNREDHSKRQVEALAQIINEAVTLDDDLENAVSTCFLEHLHQVGSYKALAPFLSRAAKDKTHP